VSDREVELSRDTAIALETEGIDVPVVPGRSSNLLRRSLRLGRTKVGLALVGFLVLIAVENGWYDTGDGRQQMVIIGAVVAADSAAADQCADCFETV